MNKKTAPVTRLHDIDRLGIEPSVRYRWTVIGSCVVSGSRWLGHCFWSLEQYESSTGSLGSTSIAIGVYVDSSWH